ncbi:glycosyltransferase [Bacillus sp. SG-1]|uniref:glycosyltransferase n=1 Tax=Bacillus sp. SG-1 TaxID=161544 RepID=UPI0001544280|nr:glycosyltransferase [Bacillus sp. SG-1]EDL64770.1 glycosyl transferase, family 2 [Bacillus sp. SG-1]
MLFILLTINIIGWLIISFNIFWGLRKIEALEDADGDHKGPLISIIVPARNEAHTIRKSIQSQLDLNYENVEWIIVNDRSTDKTGDEIEQIAACLHLYAEV